MAMITFTTDWGDDLYIGMAKGVTLQLMPDAVLVDLSHLVKPFQVVEAAFVLAEGYRYFPKGTVHLLSVNAESSPQTPWVAMAYDGHFFVGADNGFIGLLTASALPECVVYIEKYSEGEYPSFPALSVLIPAAVSLAQGEPITGLGPEVHTWNQRHIILPSISSTVIQGKVIYIDRYRNAITNITRTDFVRVAQGRPFEIWLESSLHRINRITERYNETADGELLALFNSLGLLEIAMNKGFVADMFSLTTQSSIMVKFQNDAI